MWQIFDTLKVGASLSPKFLMIWALYTSWTTATTASVYIAWLLEYKDWAVNQAYTWTASLFGTDVEERLYEGVPPPYVYTFYGRRNEVPLMSRAHTDVMGPRDWRFIVLVATVVSFWLCVSYKGFVLLYSAIRGRTKAIFQLESTVEGSVLRPGRTPPKFQVEMRDGNGNFIGWACRVRDWLVSPAHVWDVSAVAHKDGRTHKLGDRKEIATDLVASKLSVDDWSTLGVGKPSVAAELALAYVTGPSGMHSVGMLETSALVGGLTYRGSTIAGFSGAGYEVGGRLVGIHIGGQGPNRGNFGYSASFVDAVLSILEKPELQNTGEMDHVDDFRDHDLVVGGQLRRVRQRGALFEPTPEERYQQLMTARAGRLNVGQSTDWADEVEDEEFDELRLQFESLKHTVKVITKERSLPTEEQLVKEAAQAIADQVPEHPNAKPAVAAGRQSRAAAGSSPLVSQPEASQSTQRSSKLARRNARRRQEISALRKEVEKLNKEALNFTQSSSRV